MINLSSQKKIFFQISIDGPSGVGKSTLAKELSKKLNFLNINTGKIFRAIAWYMMKNEFSSEEEAIKFIREKKNLEFKKNNVFFNKEEISEYELKKTNISKLSSKISQNFYVREFALEIEHDLAKSENVIMEGRDIGTNVFPNAILKIYLYADINSRAQWRYAELKAMNLLDEKNCETIKNEMIKRDKNDMNRKLNPLKKADDAIEINSAQMSMDELVKKIENIFKEKMKNIKNETNAWKNYSENPEIKNNLYNLEFSKERKI